MKTITEQLDVDVGEAEVDFYQRNGYLAIERITTDEELEWLRRVYDDLISRPRDGFLDGVFDLTRSYGTTDEPKVGQLLAPERFVPEIRETAMWKNAHRIASRLLQVDPSKVENWGHLIFKTPNSREATPWHQDEAYWGVKNDYRALGAWFPLDDVFIENGCMWFLPGSHKNEVLPHKHGGGNDPSVHILEIDVPYDTSAGVPVPLKAGGMTFHHCRTLHYAGPNLTSGMRRAWANEYQTTPVRRDVPANRPWVDAGKQALMDSMARRT